MYYSTAEVAVLTGTFISDRVPQPKHNIRHARFNFFYRDLAGAVVHVSIEGWYTVFPNIGFGVRHINHESRSLAIMGYHSNPTV